MFNTPPIRPPNPNQPAFIDLSGSINAGNSNLGPRPTGPRIRTPHPLNFPPPLQRIPEHVELRPGGENERVRLDRVRQMIETQTQRSINEGLASIRGEINGLLQPLINTMNNLQIGIEANRVNEQRGGSTPNLSGQPRRHDISGEINDANMLGGLNPRRRLSFPSLSEGQAGAPILPLQNYFHGLPNASGALQPRLRGENVVPPLYKWGLVFDGNRENLAVDEFIFQVEHMCNHYRISWEELLRDFHFLLAKDAKSWYWLLIRTEPIRNWPELKKALLARYQVSKSDFEIMKEILERRQQPGESVDYFFQSVLKLRANLKNPVPEIELVKILKRNLRENIGRIVYAMAIFTVEQLRYECVEIERQFLRRDNRQIPQNNRSYQISEIETNQNKTPFEDNFESQIDAFAMRIRKSFNNQDNAQSLVCWNCRSANHTFVNCPSEERNVFCYKCGLPDVVLPKCPRCKQGNQQKNANLSGESRSPQQPGLQE